MKTITSLLFLLVLAVPEPVNGQIHTVVTEGAYSRTVKEWTAALHKVSPDDSTSYVFKYSGGEDSLHRNRHRDAIIWIPRTTCFSKPVTVIFWFHGHWGFVPDRTLRIALSNSLCPIETRTLLLLFLRCPGLCILRPLAEETVLCGQSPGSLCTSWTRSLLISIGTAALSHFRR